MDFIIAILIGAVAGWIASTIMKDRGFGFFGNTIIGLLGGVAGNALDGVFPLFDGSDGLLGAIFLSTVGALVLLFIAGLFKRRT
jgi:uncharacterized membrane protein YeaQ/YmgE (transglycosylase-associated protein family)